MVFTESKVGFKQELEDKLQLEAEKKQRSTVVNSTLLDEREVTKRNVDWYTIFDDWQANIEAAYPLAYMLDRGFHPKILDKWAIGWDIISQRVSIPIRDEHGNLIGFKGRSVDAFPKYLVLGGTEYGFETYEVSRVLVGLHLAEDTKDLIVVEGELNALAMHQKGHTNTVGISGKMLSEYQINLIKKYADTVTFIFDEVRDTNNAAQLLRDSMPTYVTPKHGKDPADMYEDELNTLLTGRRSAVLL
jgi:hypothetical protein